MTPSLHPLRAMLAAGRTLAGIWSVIPSAPLVGTLAASGFDFVILDAEHGGYDFGSLDAAITACEDGGASPLVRSPGADAFFIQRALDLGADGVVVPQIADEAAAARAVAMMHYAPLGTRDYLVKRKPAVLDLALRGFMPRVGRLLFRSRLDRYEMRDVIDADPERDIVDVAAMSGACMLLRRKAVDQTGGFDPRFFLYFEDYDWTVRLNKVTRTAYVPSFEVVHHGGGASRKGMRHVGHFMKGGWRYYRKHGWKWL